MISGFLSIGFPRIPLSNRGHGHCNLCYPLFIHYLKGFPVPPIPKVFISYAHKDAMDFTRRLAFALGMYMNVFWDRRLQQGDLPSQLENEIKSSNYVLYIMTPGSKNSKWCLQEIIHARNYEKPIIPIRIYLGEDSVHKQIIGNDVYCDFTDDFDAGFRSLTSKIFNQPYSSWEAYPNLSNNDLLKALEKGLVPGLIAREISEWLIAEYIWDTVRKTVETSTVASLIYIANPRTPIFVLNHCKYVLQQIIDAPKLNPRTKSIVGKIIGDLEPIVIKLNGTSDGSHKKLGILAAELIGITEKLLRGQELKKRDFLSYAYFEMGLFQFDVAEKLREYINIHSRRSRYLY